MAIRLEQVQKLQQKLILSPQMQQAIQLLQLPLTELRQTAAQEIAKNPLLEEIPDTEIETGTSGEIQITDVEKATAKQGGEGQDLSDAEHDNDLSDASAQFAEDVHPDQKGSREDSENTLSEFKDEFTKLTELDDEWREYFRQTASFRKQTSEDEEKQRFFESSITTEETLEDHLKDQLSLLDMDPRKKKICETIIGNLDQNGFLQAPLEEVMQSSGATLQETEKCLQLIQTFHPVGAGSRSLKECLLIQLKHLGQENSLAATIIRDHLEDLAKKKVPLIAKKIGTTPEMIKEAILDIEQLEPRPGRIFSGANNFYPIPDIIVQKNDDGDYEVFLNDERIPHLRISKIYRQLMEEGGNEKTKEYIREKVRAGLWFIKNIQQRQNTIHNIGKELLRVQREFMEKGSEALKPLTMQQVADAIGVHESTISRAVANKYIQTPQGLYQLKYFFTGGLATVSGEATSTTSVKDKIKELVGNENKEKPLADQEIIEILNREGVKLARRTVAKYRKELQILPSHLRKGY